jgi:AraC-like DNA-binding protein
MTTSQSRYFFDQARIPRLGHVSVAGIQVTSGLPKHPLRVFGHYALVYITDGVGELIDERGLNIPVSAGDLLFVFPEIGHTYSPLTGTVWTEIFVVFDGPLFELWRQSGLLDPRRPILHLEPVEFWARQLVDTVWSVPQSGRETTLVRLCRLQQFVADARRHAIGTADGERGSRWLSQATMLLESDLTRQPDYTRIAQQLGMSYDGFRKRFVKEMGLSPGKYHGQYRINHACLLLATESVTLKEIATRLGFSDEFHLSKRFKQIIGMSPREFRKFFTTNK